MNGAGLLPNPVELIALDPARNIRRRYSITVSVDLFGMIVVESRWGRIGARGQAQLRIPGSSRPPFRFDPGRASELMPATIPSNSRPPGKE